MATFLLDTSLIIDAINGKRDRGQFLKGLLKQRHLLACCPINVTEVYASLRPKEEAIALPDSVTKSHLSNTIPALGRMGNILSRVM